MKNNIFRNKSIERISSPEQLNDYVRVTNPGIWMAFAAIAALLIGMCVWGFFGKMITTLPSVALVREGRAVCFVKEEQIARVQCGMEVRINEEAYHIADISSSPVKAEELTEYAMHIAGLSEGDWVYELLLDGTPEKEGVYSSEIVVESISPISFVLN